MQVAAVATGTREIEVTPRAAVPSARRILTRTLPTVAIGFALGLLATAPAWALAECPQRATPAPLPSSAPLAVGMTVIAGEGLASPRFAALRPPSGAPMGVHLYTVYEDPLGVNDFWQQLKLQATPTFLHDVDFLGLHTYPNVGSQRPRSTTRSTTMRSTCSRPPAAR